MSQNRPGHGGKVSGLLAQGRLQAPTSKPSLSTVPAAGTAPPPPVAASALDIVHKAEWELAPDGQVFMIPVELVVDSPFQPEDETLDRYDPEGISELSHTLAHEGQREPIQVRLVNGRFELIAGHRRIRAARLLGWIEIEAKLLHLDDAGAERALMVHNEGVKGDPDYRKAKRYQTALNRGYAKNQTDLGAMFAAAQGTVSRRLKMLRLPAPILALLDENNALFACTTGLVVDELAQAHPTKIDLLTQAVMRLKTEGAHENSIKSWFMQRIQADIEPEKASSRRQRVITDGRGKPLYTAKVQGRAVMVQLNDTNIMPDVILEKLAEYLRKLTEETENSEPEK